jgi:2-(1,2-epoxy-1,2-dihydrophenyl)acetyl-CoA isomerase
MSVLLDHPAPGIWRLLINRPDKRNAINHEVRQALIENLQASRRDPGCRAVVLGGVAGMFSAGGDIASMADLTEAGARQRMQHIHQLCHLLESLPLPVVAAAEGFCVGAGVGMALLADVIVASPASKFQFPFMRLGLTPDWGSLRTLPARVGLGKAKQMLSHGQVISGEQALASGLVDELSDQPMAAAISYATLLAALPQDAFARMKRRLNQPAASFAEELQREEDDQAVLLLGADFREGFAAFNDKREPRFVARVEQSV